MHLRPLASASRRRSSQSPLPKAPPAMSQRKLFVTTALPYANGKFHVGHIMEYIQADIWVRLPTTLALIRYSAL